MKRILLLLTLLALPVQSFAKLNVVATLPEFAAVVQELGGDNVNVTSLTKASQDPHYVDAKPSYVLAINRADLLIINGLDLEIGWIPTLIVQARNPKVQIGQSGYLDASELAAPILEIPTGTIDRSMGDIHPGGNPHYSRDPKRMLNVIRGIGERMMVLAPEQKAQIQANMQVLLGKVQTILSTQQSKWAKLSPEERNLVEYHKSWSYLFETLNITTPIRIEPKPGVPPSPGHVATVVKTIRSENVKLLIQESYLAARVMETVAKLTKSKHLIVESGPNFAAGEPYADYLEKLLNTFYNHAKFNNEQ